MKTPEEIKKDLVSQISSSICRNCPHCLTALELIEQHEKEKEALLKALKAADIYGECENCKYNFNDDSKCKAADYLCAVCDEECQCGGCLNGSNWQWIGVQEEANADG